eukprot:TRINITY_DN1791_c0_g1_i1.p1 TRINITY_DN1791_c0_g1~~TRINITY_DN1791_c0_g1_i1.p1  ORF type:complete len:467 (-),score=138.08 TRINITY_DN1791_c0_g1_i1:226-1626(-)
MSKPNKPPKRGISVASLSSPDKDGWLTKQGGSWKSWKRRWFVLKGDSLYYFKTQKDVEETGIIELTRESVVKEDPTNKKKKYAFSVATSPDAKRVFFMFPDTPQETQQWLNALNKAIDKKKGGGQSSSSSTSSYASSPSPSPAPAPTPSPASAAKPVASKAGGNPRDKLMEARNNIPFLQDDSSKVLEFWQIWCESLPPSEDLSPGMGIEYHLAVSVNLQKLTWRTAGPQNVFIQKMVDFFWNVGAPETEIDRLNDVGALLNPIKIGSWIDMSAQGGMDGGWFFPVDISMKVGLEAADPGDSVNVLKNWIEKHSVDKCYCTGRDMGAAPPRQTEFRLKLPNLDFGGQLRLCEDAFQAFGFPPISPQALDILRNAAPGNLCLSVITSSDGFVRLGLLAPKPSKDVVGKLCTLMGEGQKQLNVLEGALGSQGPANVEFLYLKEGFGYGVYKEGFDVVFHYELGEERVD